MIIIIIIIILIVRMILIDLYMSKNVCCTICVNKLIVKLNTQPVAEVLEYLHLQVSSVSCRVIGSRLGITW